jgi:DNA-binding transcriptional LysR family regulator
VHIGSLDANLLAPLQALLELQHVSKAADRMHVSQSAMSSTLARLRRLFDDELLVRAGSSYSLTPRAMTLLPLVNQAVQSLESVFDVRVGFDPSVSDRRFRILASDYAAGVVNPGLRRLLAMEGPSISVEFHSMPNHPIVDREALEFDLIIGPLEYGMPGHHTDLFYDDFVCLLDAAHPALRSEDLTVGMLIEIPHATVSFASNMSTGADRLLSDLGVQGRVALVTDTWFSLPWLVRGTDLVALLPRRVASWWADRGGFGIREIPGGDSGPFTEALFWHPSRQADQGLAWLREQIVRAVDASPPSRPERQVL